MSIRSNPVPLSALQHWLYCPRQYGLIHIERLWTENQFTAEGRVLHERVDAGNGETRPGIRILRGVELCSHRFGLAGRADVVELRGGHPYPVEYKRGRPKHHRADEVQLCAQGLCLEEMFECTISEGALFYGKTRRRKLVRLDDTLRSLTCEIAEAVRACRESGRLPHMQYDAARCDACSLIEDCRPRTFGRKRPVSVWLRGAIESTRVPE